MLDYVEPMLSATLDRVDRGVGTATDVGDLVDECRRLDGDNRLLRQKLALAYTALYRPPERHSP